jgi:hypothetical protein
MLKEAVGPVAAVKKLSSLLTHLPSADTTNISLNGKSKW